jgi:nucleotide-binding universal stress UspA family protein
MYKKILIATDGSELAGRAVAHGLSWASRFRAFGTRQPGQ